MSKPQGTTFAVPDCLLSAGMALIWDAAGPLDCVSLFFSDQRPKVDGRPDAGLRGPGRKHQDLEHYLETGVKEVGIAVDIGLWMMSRWFKPPTSSSKYFSF